MKTIKLIIMLFCLLSFLACKKDESTPQPGTENAQFEMGISDAKSAHNKKSATNEIIDASKLTKCEITISLIELKNSSGTYVTVLDEPATIDLRQFKGEVKDLVSSKIEIGSYQSVKVSVSGVSTTYSGNSYSASVTGGAQVNISDLPGVTFDESHGVVNAFANGAIAFELPLEVELKNSENTASVRLFFDAEASVYEIPISYQSFSWNFAGIRAIPNVSIILEEGIQQIKHSPPMGITVGSGLNVEYYGIHTFIDFNQKGGTINSHTSQHVFRGENGSLLIDVETMALNSNALSTNQIATTGETNVNADEVFKYDQISTALAGKGYTLEAGKYYYFSLRKTWNITTDGNTYDLTRICEPIPVLWQ